MSHANEENVWRWEDIGYLTPESQYLDTLSYLVGVGERVPNRTGVDTLRTLGVMHRYDFEQGFPLFTTKKVWFKGVAHELLWFLKGSTDIKYLVDNGVNIWNDDAYRYFKKVTDGQGWQPSKEAFIQSIKDYDKGLIPSTKGPLGPVYGKQWRSWTAFDSCGCKLPDDKYGIDQIANLVDGLKNNPTSRRHILTAWNVGEIEDMGLPPCHVMSQYTISNGKLWCHMYQRSCDMFLGVPFNVASYSLLTYMLAQVCDLKPGGLIHTMHDCHVYENHTPAVREQLRRKVRPLPQLELNPGVSNIDDFKYEDFKIVNYNPHPPIKAELNT